MPCLCPIAMPAATPDATCDADTTSPARAAGFVAAGVRLWDAHLPGSDQVALRSVAVADRQPRSRRSGGELGCVHRLHLGGCYPEGAGRGGPHPILEGVFALGQPFEEE